MELESEWRVRFWFWYFSRAPASDLQLPRSSFCFYFWLFALTYYQLLKFNFVFILLLSSLLDQRLRGLPSSWPHSTLQIQIEIENEIDREIEREIEMKVFLI